MPTTAATKPSLILTKQRRDFAVKSIAIRRLPSLSNPQSLFKRRVECTRCQSGRQDMDEEALDRALKYQQKQVREQAEATARESTIEVPEEKVPKVMTESKKTQNELATRLGKMGDAQILAAIQRQVGASRADWTDAANPDTRADTPEAPESSTLIDVPEQTKKPTPMLTPSPPPPTPRSTKKAASKPKSKMAPKKRFADGSVLYTADQFE